MNFRQHMNVAPVTGVQLVPFLNFFLIVIVFLMFVSQLAMSMPLGVRLPKVITSDMTTGKEIVVVVSGENIMYVHDKVVTLGELRGSLAFAGNDPRSLLIKVDRRASMGRVVEIWDLARSLGFTTVNLAADREE